MAMNLEQARIYRQEIYDEIQRGQSIGMSPSDPWITAKLDEYERVDAEIIAAEQAGEMGIEQGSLTGDVVGDFATEYAIGAIGEKVDEVAQVHNVWNGYQTSRTPWTAGAKAVDELIEFSDNIGDMDDYEASEKGFKAGFQGASAFGADPVTAGIVGSITATLGFGLNATGIGGSGKSKQQKLKDQYKYGLQNAGIIEEYGKLKKIRPDINVVGSPDVTGSTRLIQLADGSYFNFEETEKGAIRADGSKKEVYGWDATNEDQRKNFKKNETNANLVDYTNSLDYWTSKGADALASITFGKNTTDEGTLYTAGTFTNAATANTTDREWNETNFKKSMENMRGFYKQSGVETFTDAKARSQEMLEAGLIDDETYARHLEGYQLVFNENFEYADEFENGDREGRGIYAAKNKK